MWIPFARVGHEHLGELWEFVTDETADVFARGAAVTGIVAMHHFHPDRRAEVVGFIERLLGLPDVFPADHLAGFLCECADSGLTELADRAKEFASHMDNHETRFDEIADASDIRKAFRNGAQADFISRRAHDVYGVNEQWSEFAESQEHDEVVDEEEATLPGFPRVPESSGKKIGRNEPCPCGSGKKYKKCHGR